MAPMQSVSLTSSSLCSRGSGPGPISSTRSSPRAAMLVRDLGARAGGALVRAVRWLLCCFPVSCKERAARELNVPAQLFQLVDD